MDILKILSTIAIGSPLCSALVIGLLNKSLSKKVTSWLACLLMTVTFVTCTIIFIGLIIGRFAVTQTDLYTFVQSGSLHISVGVLIDRLSALLMLVVSFVSLMVHVYSIGYMHDDPGYQRFFCYISLFTFAMLMLVMANNLAQLFFGWEAVGLLSYLLIGFWYKKETATFASLKAFLVNRVGDVGFVVGIAAALYYFNSLNYYEIFQQVQNLALAKPMLTLLPSVECSAITFICYALFVGAMAKSAQVPLHVWLPDSMEGPTPISALIHAATMVTAGIFMVARMSPIFEYSASILSFMILIGATTCLLMGVLAIVQTDIKRIIAYSTLSQLGLMVVALGVSAYSAAIFHLFTHAFFKALLFLAAGSVILSLHHEQNIFKMGNLRRYMPISCATMLVGGLALIGFPGTSGFYSKDLIITASLHSNVKFAELGYYVTLFTVILTTIYTFRMVYLVFFGADKIGITGATAVNEAPKVIWIPLVLLSIPSIIAGAIFVNPILDGFLGDAIFVLGEHDTIAVFKAQDYHGALAMFLHGFVAWPFLCILIGLIVVWLCYIKYPLLPAILQKDLRPISIMLEAKFWFDAFNQKIIIPTSKMLGRVFWQFCDVILIDDMLVNGSARRIERLSQVLKTMQTGYLYHYVFIIISGLLALLIWTIYI